MSWRHRKRGIDIRSAVSAVRKHGLLLVYPINNKPLPLSLWSHFFPRSPMRWVWDENGDDRIVKVWDLRERMSQRTDVVYGKWYQNRATFFSPEVFTALLVHRHGEHLTQPALSETAGDLLELLLENSPQSTKQLRQHTKTEWGWDKKTHEAAMRQLWQDFLIVGQGEVDDGAFPSLNVSATAWRFESLWTAAQDSSRWEDLAKIRDKHLPVGSPWRRALDRKVKKAKTRPRRTTVRWEDLSTKS